MAKELTTRENTDVALSKSKSFMGIIKNIFNNKVVIDDDSWMQRLWDWADENDISDLEWVDNKNYDDGGYWEGLSRNKENLLKIKKLNLGFSNITYLPGEIGNLTSLVDFNLEYSNLTELPKEIGRLTNLTKFNLLSSDIVYLPKEIGDLISLVDFNLEYSNLTELPQEIGNLTNLRNLNLDHNNLTELPKEIGKLVNLQNLNLGSSSIPEHSLDNNNLSELPREIGDLINLTELDLQFNNIIELPREIGNLINLTELYLWHNDLTELPREIGELSNLEVLNLWSNKFKKLPDEIGDLINLAWLYLDNNYLAVLPKNIGNLTNLLGLYVENNNLTELPNSICNLQNLEVLKLSNNPLILTEEQQEWIKQLIDDGCDVDFDDIWKSSLVKIESEGSLTDKLKQTKFNKLIEKIYNRNFELGDTFRNNVEFDSYIDNKLTWTSSAIGTDKELLDTHWGLVNMFVKDIFGFETEVVNLNEETEEVEDENTFTFDNGRQLWSPPRMNTTIVECLYAIIHNFSDKKLCILKEFNDVENAETDIYYSIIGQKHLDYSGSSSDVEQATVIYEKSGSIGVCNSGIDVKPSSYIEWRFDFYHNDIYLESILFENNIRTELYSRTLKNGPSELFDAYQMYIENGYKEAFKILDDMKEENDSAQSNKIRTSKYSNEEILGTSYNMIKEVFDDSDGNKPISNHASFFIWSETISVLKEDNGEALIKLDDGTGYAIAYDADKIIFIVKEIDGTPAFVNKQFYEKFYQEIHKNKNV